MLDRLDQRHNVRKSFVAGLVRAGKLIYLGGTTWSLHEAQLAYWDRLFSAASELNLPPNPPSPGGYDNECACTDITCSARVVIINDRANVSID